MIDQDDDDRQRDEQAINTLSKHVRELGALSKRMEGEARDRVKARHQEAKNALRAHREEKDGQRVDKDDD